MPGSLRARLAPVVLGAIVLGCLTDPIPPGASVALELVAQIPASAGHLVALQEAPDGSGRIFVLGQQGVVYVLQGGAVSGPILEMDDEGIDLTSDFEGGALDLAFHPNFAGLAGPAGRGLFYTYTHEEVDGAPDFDHPELAAVDGNGQTLVREWRMSDEDPEAVAPGSRVLLRIDQPQANHNGGGLAFDANALLHVALGDGGGGNDFSGFLDNPADGHTNGIGNGQDGTNVYGTILRIDPLGSDSANGQYGIPQNPFSDDDEGWPKEIYAYGFRNPYRISFDETGDLWTGDVGQGEREEIHRVVPGGNHGWPFFEGSRVNRAGGPAGTVPPVGEYTHGDGIAVLGGYVYGGAAIPALQGRYVFGDFISGGLGQLYSMDTGSGAIEEFVLLPGSEGVPGPLFGIGRDADGEIYYLMSPFGGTGSILRLVAAPGDRDGDGVADEVDVCPGVPDAGQGDADADGVGDACDVCIEAADAGQADRDLDGFGDACDCDFDGDGACNLGDFGLLLPDVVSGVEATPGTDMNGDDTVNLADYFLFLPGIVSGFPGPSAP